MPDLLTHGDRPISSLVSGETAARIERAATRMRYGDGRLIHSRGDDRPGFSLVVDGAVRFVKPLVNGDELTVSVLGVGHSFGEATIFAGMGRAYDAVAVGDTVIDQVSKPAFERLLDSEPMLARALLEATTTRLYSVLSLLDDMRSLPLDARTAKLIAGMASSAKNPDRIECRQSDLAFTLGVSRVSIGKALTALQAAGVIALGYGEIHIPDRKALAAWIAEREA